MFGEERLVALLKRLIKSGASLDKLLESINKLRQNTPLSDDISIFELLITQ